MSETAEQAAKKASDAAAQAEAAKKKKEADKAEKEKARLEKVKQAQEAKEKAKAERAAKLKADREQKAADRLAAKEAKKAARLSANLRKNGAVRPKDGTLTSRVWEIADEISRQSGRPAQRAEVLAQAQVVGLNPSMTATQFGRWRKFHEVPPQVRTAAVKPAPEAAKPAPEAAKPSEKKGSKKKATKASGDVTTEAA